MSLTILFLLLHACSSPTLSVTVVNKTAKTIDSFILHYDGEANELIRLEPNEPQTVVIHVPTATSLSVEWAGQKKAIDIQFHMEPQKTLDLRIEDGDVVSWTYTIDDIFAAPIIKTGIAGDISNGNKGKGTG